MSALSRSLQWLKLSRKKPCHLITTPDPRKCFGLERWGSNIQEYRLKFEGSFNLYLYSSHNPNFGYAMNGDGSRLPPNAQPSEHTGSVWINLIAKDEPTVTSDGKTSKIREVLVEILDKFPTYDLQSEKGFAEAMNDMETKINAVASSETLEVDD